MFHKNIVFTLFNSFQKRLKDMAIIIPGAIVTFAGVCVYEGNEKFYREYVMPAFHMFGAETAHKMAVKAAKYGLVPRQRKPDPPSLVSTKAKHFMSPFEGGAYCFVNQ